MSGAAPPRDDLSTLPRRPPALASLAPLLVVGVFAATFAALVGWPRWPVVDAWARIAPASLVAGAIAIAATFVRHEVVRLALNLAAALACVVPAMLPMAGPNAWGYGGLALRAGVVGLLAALAASSAQRLRERDPSPLAMLVMLGLAAATGGLLLSTGSLKLGQAGFGLAGGVAAALALGLIVRPLGRGAAATNGAITATLAVTAGLLVSGHLWSELPLYAAACVIVAPFFAWASRAGPIAHRPRWQRVVVGLLVAAIPAVVAVGVEARRAYAASQAQGTDDYGY